MNHPKPTALRRALLAGCAIAGTALVTLGVVATVALKSLTPQADEWQTVVHVGPWQRAVSVPVLLRWASHPLVMPWFNHRTWFTRSGAWRLRTTHDGNLAATCAPCALRWSALGSAPLPVASVQVDLQRSGPDAWRGTVTLGSPAAATTQAPHAQIPIRLSWHATLHSRALAISASLPPTDVASLVQALAADTPEAKRAQVAGTVAFEFSGRVGAQGLHAATLVPRLTGLHVSGLGTEWLATALPPARCLGPARQDLASPAGRLASQRVAPEANAEAEPEGKPVEGWLPRAVIAAEDQRFHEHAGYDLTEWMVSLTRNQREGARARGASTLTQQVAKMVFTGDQRSATRKLREWLYAVEMERTLGKARILQLYLALAPWGDDACGAHAAAQRHLGRPVESLALHEAAWLASLLNRPDAQLAAWRHRGELDRARVAHVIESLRPLAKPRRQAAIVRWQTWTPPSPASRHEPQSRLTLAPGPF